ncbi:hypothetical protein GUJ93_ZPchr0005g15452 [Zizania palustris]|uniref:Uncharacterized protein n=1 Tax=Zizania palustris TaxID=103762 RepID=A0A8J5SXB3_ZIZPA|nr:hypothetical protein GUJ93_ZPchr0005g15452 [Zizania palustris]
MAARTPDGRTAPRGHARRNLAAFTVARDPTSPSAVLTAMGRAEWRTDGRRSVEWRTDGVSGHRCSVVSRGRRRGVAVGDSATAPQWSGRWRVSSGWAECALRRAGSR